MSKPFDLLLILHAITGVPFTGEWKPLSTLLSHIFNMQVEDYITLVLLREELYSILLTQHPFLISLVQQIRAAQVDVDDNDAIKNLGSVILEKHSAVLWIVPAQFTRGMGLS